MVSRLTQNCGGGNDDSCPTVRVDSHSEAATASPTPVAGGSHHYFAFLSYSHRNQPMADWLHQALERFVVPRTSSAGSPTTARCRSG